jgi:hypothetical protein
MTSQATEMRPAAGEACPRTMAATVLVPGDSPGEAVPS